MNAVNRFAYLVVFIAVSLVGCKQSTVTDDIPAVLSEPSASARAEIQATISGALDNESITLAPSAFTSSSSINLEHRAIRDAQGTRIMGRDLGKPIQFRLVINGENCVLFRPDTDERWILDKVECKAES